MVPAAREQARGRAVRNRDDRYRRQSRDVLDAAAVRRQGGRREEGRRDQESYNAAPADPKRRTSPAARSSATRRRCRQTRAIRSCRPRRITFKAGDFVKTTSRDAELLSGGRDVAEVGIKPIQKLLVAARISSPRSRIRSSTRPTASARPRTRDRCSSSSRPRSSTFGGAGHEAKSDSLGALARPQMSLLGLSKILGPVSGQNAADARRSRARWTR